MSDAVTFVGRRSTTSESGKSSSSSDMNPRSSSSSSSSSLVLDFNSPRQPKRMSFVRLLGLNAIVCGIEFCGSAAFCFIPPMLLKSGIGERNMSLVLGVGPLMGLFVVPLVGRWSDRCRSRFGRRRPFIFALSAILVFSLLVLVSARTIGAHLGSHAPSKDLGRFVSISLLVIGSIFLDFTCQVCLTPCEALLSDLSKDTDQHGRCFTVYSIMVSFGGCVGYLMTALDWSDNILGSYFDSQENCVFFLLIVMFSVSAIFTFASAREVPLGQAQKSQEGQNKLPRSVDSLSIPMAKEDTECNPSAILSNISTLKTYLYMKSYDLLPNVLKQLLDIPIALRRLALANFCSWTSIMIFNLFYTDFVGQAIYRGDPNSPENSNLRKLYDEGVRMGSWGLLLHCILSALYAAFVDRIVSALNLRVVYLFGMVSFTFSIFVLMFSSSIWLANLCATCTGFGYATLTTVPYLLLTSYHDNLEVFFSDTKRGSCIPDRGMGTDLSTLDSAYFLSQVVLTSFMGYIVQQSGSVVSYVVCSFIMGLVSCLCICRIIHEPQHMWAAHVRFTGSSK